MFYLNVAEQLMKSLKTEYVEGAVLRCCQPCVSLSPLVCRRTYTFALTDTSRTPSTATRSSRPIPFSLPSLPARKAVRTSSRPGTPSSFSGSATLSSFLSLC